MKTTTEPTASLEDQREPSERLAVLMQEREGMAEELFRVYEHLGVISALTRDLLALRCEQDACGVVVGSLRATYRDEIIAVVKAGASTPATGVAPKSCAGTEDCMSGDVAALPAWIHAGIDESRGDRRVRAVHPERSCGLAANGAVLRRDEALIAPVFAGDTSVCVLVLWRHSDDRPVSEWDSADMSLFDALTAFVGDAIRNLRLLQELRQMSMEMVGTLVNAIDQKDPYTSGHSNRVGYFAKLLASELGFDVAQLRTLEYSALLHDVGKIGIRDDVLKKPGKLTAEEFEHIKEHPVRGYEIVRENRHMREMLDGVLYHHEHYDGRGYPKGLVGDDIPLQARIIQIADVFDALTTNRSYRNAFSWQKALTILEDEAGTVVHPELTATFVALIKRLHEQDPGAFDAIGRVDAHLCLTDAFEPSR